MMMSFVISGWWWWWGALSINQSIHGLIPLRWRPKRWSEAKEYDIKRRSFFSELLSTIIDQRERTGLLADTLGTWHVSSSNISWWPFDGRQLNFIDFSSIAAVLCVSPKQSMINHKRYLHSMSCGLFYYMWVRECDDIVTLCPPLYWSCAILSSAFCESDSLGKR